MWRIVTWLIFLLILSVMVLLTLPNTHHVTLNYYLDSLQLPLTVLLLMSLTLGVLLGIVFNLIWVWNLSYKNKRLKKHYQQLLADNLNEVHVPEDAS
ncbi:MAG: LapA family protein [Pseudomonadota bacterium]|nr:LapA family protein [Pseudomonadota bacterium]